MASRCLSFRHPSWVWAEKTGNCPWPPKKVCHFVVQILFWVWEISVLLLIEIDIRNLHRHKILCLNLMLITSGVSLCCPKKYASCLKTTTLNVSKPLKMAAIIMNVSNRKSVNFSRRESVQLLADAQWSYYARRTQ